MNGFWDIGIADIIAWVVGIIAIIIAVLIYLRQENVNKKIDKLRKSNIQLSLTRIYDQLNQMRELTNMFRGNVNNNIEFYKKDTDVLRNMLKNNSGVFLYSIKIILEEDEFLRINPVPADLYADIKECGDRLKIFIDGDYGVVARGIPDTVDNWLRYGERLIERLDQTIKKVAEELAS